MAVSVWHQLPFVDTSVPRSVEFKLSHNVLCNLPAQIFCTVSNDEKVCYLTETLGIPRERIFDSRSVSFYQDLMNRTDGRGVDIVLNSLSGKLLHTSWKCVAAFGKMIEIGK